MSNVSLCDTNDTRLDLYGFETDGARKRDRRSTLPALPHVASSRRQWGHGVPARHRAGGQMQANASCVACRPGRFKPFSGDSCTRCSSATYPSDRASCQPCPAYPALVGAAAPTTVAGYWQVPRNKPSEFPVPVSPKRVWQLLPRPPAETLHTLAAVKRMPRPALLAPAAPPAK